ncbi:MAG: PEP-CTERM sorting domain-containing protein [Fimbriimonadaceae bacterium]|nr:MAG: PEP-CTERM sorting domain-containing protein [Fimbriimonadaceae bacterium]
MLLIARRVSVLGFALLASLSFGDNLRVATWNISNYTGGRDAAIANAVYGTFQGRSFRPDVLFAQEVQSASAASALRTILNNAAGSPGDWQVSFGSLTGTGSTSDTAMFYRSSKVNTVSANLVAASAGTAGNPRDVWRFDFSITGNAATSERFGVYNSHMKSGSGTDEQARRQVEALAIRNNSNALSSNYQIMSLGDFNVQSSSQQAYQTLVGSSSNNDGRFFDPIGTPGSWNGNSAYRFVHTQDPTGSGGMDDRHDQILMGGKLGDGIGTEYVGAFGTTYSTSTWDDADHSYRAWGNDGTSFNNSLTVNGNTMVGSSIAQSLKDVAVGGGHLPVFADISFEAVPEPGTMLVLGSLALVAARRRKKN